MAIKAASGIAVTFNATAVTAYLNTASQETIVSELEATTFASTASQGDPGLPGHSFEMGGDWAKALDDVLYPAAATPTKVNLVVVVGQSGSQATYTWTANAFVSNYRWEASDPKGKITWSARIALSGNPVRT